MTNRFHESRINVERAEAASDANRHDAAIDLAMKAITADPTHGDGYASLGRACLGLGRHKEAEEHFRHALSIEPESPWYLGGLSVCLRLQDRADEALEFTRELIRLYPTLGYSHEMHGHSLRIDKQFEASIEAYEQALRFDPECEESLMGNGLSLLRLNKPKEAEAIFRRALVLNPNRAACVNNLGVSLEGQGKLKESAVAYKAAVMIDPTYQIAKSNTASAVDRYLAVGGGVTLGVLATCCYVAIRVFGSSAMTKTKNALVISAGLVVAFGCAIGIMLLYKYIVSKKRKLELQIDDPQLLDIYQTIKRNNDY